MRARRFLAGLGCWVSLAACDGYPTEDEPSLAFAEMTAAELVDELNRIGERRHLKPRRSYTLREGCALEVAVHGKASQRTRMTLVLEGATVRSRIDPETREHRVTVEPPRPDPDEDAAPVVIEGGKWVDAVQVRSLLQHLQRSCRASAPEESGAPSTDGRATRLQRSRPT